MPVFAKIGESVARRGIFRRIVAAVFRREEKRPPPIPPPISAPRAPTVGRRELRRDVIEKMASMSAKANRTRITTNVGHMTDSDLRWTMQATADQIRARAKADADRVIAKDGSVIPLNPWWYR